MRPPAARACAHEQSWSGQDNCKLREREIQMHHKPARVCSSEGRKILARRHTCVRDRVSGPRLRKACLHGTRLRAGKTSTSVAIVRCTIAAQSTRTTGSRMLITTGCSSCWDGLGRFQLAWHPSVTLAIIIGTFALL
eukprot:6184404-Pleurochrysis_carterae.AAC.1